MAHAALTCAPLMFASRMLMLTYGRLALISLMFNPTRDALNLETV